MREPTNWSLSNEVIEPRILRICIYILFPYWGASSSLHKANVREYFERPVPLAVPLPLSIDLDVFKANNDHIAHLEK